MLDNLPVIQLNSVSKTFHQPKQVVQALKDVSLSINNSEIYGLIGVNGSGKTTLAKIISTLLIPDCGRVLVLEIDALSFPGKVKEHIGISLGEGRSFYFRLTAEQNLEFFGTMLEIPPKKLKKRINELLELLDLKWANKTPYMEFSSGMKRKLDLARAMLAYPDIYILDEPTNGIDPLSQDVIRSMIFNLKKEGKTILLITHNLYEANILCDRVGILDKGVLLWQGSIEDFSEHKETSILECSFKESSYDSNSNYSSNSNTNFTLTESLISELSNLPFVKKITKNCYDNGYQIFFSKGNGGLNKLLSFVSSKDNLILERINLLTPTIEDIFREFVKVGESKDNKYA
ncbi:MAG: ABC transporter ATP-binding protein [Caldisericia bacterium]|nr:ABC transporter ATP-binding protein [Caldisericia bacterium]MDD5689035.1 ABC transporter ATP-binding protein [Caldisericia bacterium]